MKASLLLVASLLAAVSSYADTGTSAERLPDTKVEGLLQEEIPVGPYGQPEWTTARRFPNTRVYVQQPPWGIGFEQWVKAQWPKGEDANYLFQEEIEIGLPYRFQVDIYENWRIDHADSGVNDLHNVVHHDSTALEVRWALADWGKIWGNPTLYGEWKFGDNAYTPDAYEIKLLLGDDFLHGWHWGANAIYEQEVGQGRATELGLSFGLSYTVIDEKLSAGLELKIESETEKGSRDHAPLEIDLGPSIQWRPTRNTHLDVSPLVGLTSDSPHVELWAIFGFDFGPGNASAHEHAPVSLQSR